MSDIIVQIFDHPKLNNIAGQLFELDEKYKQHIQQARNEIYSAFHTRWLYGKIIYENYDFIIEQCDTQKNFADRIGQTEGVVSNNKRGYEYLLEEGCETWSDVKKKLKERNITPTVKNFEKIGTLLNEPNEDTDKKTQIEKDRYRLEQLRAEAEEILRRNEPSASPSFIEDAFEFIEDIDEIKEYVDSFNPELTGWESEKYLDFVRNFGYDVITGEQCERCDPHHTDETGGSGPTGRKLPDYYAIPVSRDTHIKLEQNLIVPHPSEILRAQFRTLTAFLNLNMK